ncbi:MAG: hypothetical protein ACP5KA_07265, partial [Desulfurococcaceae archaeon]
VVKGGRALAIGRDVDVYVQVLAVARPPTDFVELYVGRLEAPWLLLKGLRDVAREHVEELEKLIARGADRRLVEEFTRLINVNMWVVNKTSGDVVCAYSDYYGYKPYEALRKLVTLRVSVDLDGLCREISRVRRPVNVYKELKAVTREPLNEGAHVEAGLLPVAHANGGYIIFRWRLNNTIRPENLTYDPRYLKYKDGILYFKTPIYIFNNTCIPSSVIDTSIFIANTRKTGFYITIGVGGGLIAKATKGALRPPDIVIYKSSDAELQYVRGGEDFPYHYACNASFYYIWARPVVDYLQEELCYCEHGACYCDLTGNEKVEHKITHVSLRVSEWGALEYDGGFEYITRDHWINSFKEVYFNSTYSSWRYFTTLDNVRSGFWFSDIYKWVDICNAGWRLSINPGGFLALAIPKLAPAYQYLASILTVTLSHEDVSALVIDGRVLMHNYVVPESIWFRFNNFDFYQGSCKYKVPVMFYIEAYNYGSPCPGS